MEEIINAISKKTLEELKKASKRAYPLYYKNVFNSILDEKGLLEELNPKLLCISPNINEELLDKTTHTINAIKNYISLINSELEKFDENIDNQDFLKNFKHIVEQKISYIDSELDLLDNEVDKLYYTLLIDPLTKIYNRRALKQDLNEILEKGKTKDLDLVIAILDIDNFREVNEKYGHLIGDFVLIKISETIRKNIRKENYLYRLKGDQFVIIFNRTMLEVAVNSVNRILNRVSSKKLKYKNSIISVTLSAGIATHKKGDDFERIIKRATEALILAKQKKNSFEIKD